VLLVALRLAATLRDALERLAATISSSPAAQAVLVVLLFTATLILLLDLVTFPFSLYREWTLERRYELDRVPFAVWLQTHLKGGLADFAIALGAAAIVLIAVAISPEWWWVMAAVGIWMGELLLTTLTPMLLPFFVRLLPLQRPALSARLDGLVARSGARTALRIYQWGGADDTRRAHAALIGFGHTRRVLLSDSLLASCADDEIEVVVAHELAHHVHGDLWKHALGRLVLLTIAFALAQQLLATLGPTLAIRGPADPAAWPLMILVIGVVFVLTSPLTLAWSRRDERRADRYAQIGRAHV